MPYKIKGHMRKTQKSKYHQILGTAYHHNAVKKRQNGTTMVCVLICIPGLWQPQFK